MIRQSRSTSERNPEFVPMPRRDGERNLAWGERAVVQMGAAAGPGAWSYIALLGGSDTLAFRLRVAQSHLRSDMLPSYWSEAILVRLAGTTLVGAESISVPLVQPPGPAYAPAENGVVVAPLSDYDDPARYPNIALIALPKAQEKILARVELFRHARPTFDALEHVLRWLAFAWGVARTPNPLHENYGIPSAGMLETVCAAEDLELTPGLESRASCPEAIWASALHWTGFFAKTGERRVPFGRYVIGHSYPIVEPEPSAPPADRGGQEPPAAARGGRGAGTRKPAARRRRG
jgi:hypothetical protein